MMHTRNMTGPLCVLSSIALASMAALAGCSRNTGAQTDVELFTTTVQKRDVVVQVSADGVIEPIRVIEIKSKASGEILHLPVETGDVVEEGALLAQVDTTDVAAQVRQAEADLQVAKARLVIAERQKMRADTLLQRGMISKDEYDQAVLEYTVARANLIKAQTTLEQARERLEETVVRAPSAGTILSKYVEEGQIITSATREVTGGTTLMKMADLRRVQVRALVDETDLGKVRPGQRVTVQVDAYPNRRFEGTILKVEPEAVEQQGITFFPVLIRIDNEENLLRPGMNANVEIHILRRENVLALPSDVIKTPTTAPMTAPLLGLDPDSVRAVIAAAQRTHPPMPSQTSSPLGARMARGPRNPGGAPPADHRIGGSSLGVVFVPGPGGIRPVVVRIGAQSWDYTEIISGLKEGDEVIIPPSATLARQSEELRARARRWSGGVMGRR